MDYKDDVNLTFDGFNINGTVEGNLNTSELVQVLEDVKELQAETNNILTNISVIFLLFVALLGVLIGQGFAKLVKRR